MASIDYDLLNFSMSRKENIKKYKKKSNTDVKLFDESELKKDFPVEGGRLCDGGQSYIRLQVWQGLIDDNASVVQW